MNRRNLLFLTMLSTVFAGAAIVFVSTTTAQRRPARAPIPDDAPPLPENATACNYQQPIDYLVRENFLPRWTQPPEEQRRRRGLQKQAVEFRTKNYGYFEGFGNQRHNRTTPSDNATRTRFMDLPVRVNSKIVPALECVEQVIRSECGDSYTARRLSGLRTRNTYHNGQVSNHVYGIAVDVDPNLNTCCMCVAQWGDHPLCQNPVESIYERMAMPSCWVHVFERFGFYWLGRDRLQDTMHFEFLGDPDHILKTSGPAPHMATQAEAEAPEEPTEENENAETREGPAAANEAMGEAPAVEEAPAMTEMARAEEPVAPPPSGGCGCSAPGV
ncbi:MAG: M15 family metallopeptidase [Myxococcota bacterium]